MGSLIKERASVCGRRSTRRCCGTHHQRREWHRSGRWRVCASTVVCTIVAPRRELVQFRSRPDIARLDETRSPRCRRASGATPVCRRLSAPSSELRLDEDEHHLLEVVASPDCCPQAQFVPRSVDGRSAHVQRRDDQRDGPGDVGDGFDQFADSGRPCPTTDEAERNVGRAGSLLSRAADEPNPAQRRTVAASVDPPPSPPPWGSACRS